MNHNASRRSPYAARAIGACTYCSFASQRSGSRTVDTRQVGRRRHGVALLARRNRRRSDFAADRNRGSASRRLDLCDRADGLRGARHIGLLRRRRTLLGSAALRGDGAERRRRPRRAYVALRVDGDAGAVRGLRGRSTFRTLVDGLRGGGKLAPGRIPVLLVHGYLCNRGLWWWLRRRLRARRYAVATINLEPALADLDRLAERLGERVDALLAETGAEKVMLVTHSMGGLAARAYLRRHGATRVAGLVTLAAPHHGTEIARLGLGRNARQMRPNSEWLRSLNAQPPPSIPIASIWSRDDEIIDPPDTSRLPDARETILGGIGHMAMAFSPTVLACVDAELLRR